MGYKKSRVNLFFFFWRKGFAFLQVMDRNENIGKVAVLSDKSAV